MRIIAGRWRGRRLKAPAGKGVRPTTDRVREAWMSALAPVLPDARVLDLYAGSGALGLEALSRGASEVVFVERGRRALLALRANIEALEATRWAEVVKADALRYARDLPAGSFDVALADPPYDGGQAREVARRFLEIPFALELWVEHRSADAMPEATGRHQRRYGDTSLTTYRAAP